MARFHWSITKLTAVPNSNGNIHYKYKSFIMQFRIVKSISGIFSID